MKDRRTLTQGAAAMIFTAGMVCAIVGCEKDDDKVTCQSAISHFYDMGCIIVSGGEPVYNVSDAIVGCNETRSIAAEYGCLPQYQDALECLARTSYGACESCSYQFDAYNACMS